MKKRKNIYYALAILLLVGLSVGVYGYKEYNRKNTDLTETKAQFSIPAKDIITEFSENQQTSNAKYLAKIIEVSGLIKKVDADAKGSYTIVLGDKASMSSVRCSLDSNFNKDAAGLTVGQPIKIKGICTGYNADDLGIGSDVILNRCVTIKK